MPDPSVRRNAHIQIETGVADGHPEFHRLLIDGRNVSEQVRSVKFTLEAGEVADVVVTYARPHVSISGDAQALEVSHG